MITPKAPHPVSGDSPLHPHHSLAERRLEILDGILKISTEGVIVADKDMRILLFSQGAEKIFGYSEPEMLGERLEKLIPPGKRTRHRGHIHSFAESQVQSRSVQNRGEVVGLSKSGELIPLEIALSKSTSVSGLIFTALVRDISDRRKTEIALAEAVDQANAANRAKSAFLATMSHEIRTPLNGILGMVQAMAMEKLPPHQRERLRVIRRSGDSLLAILNDILDLSKIEAGKLQLEESEFDLEELVETVHATFAAIAEAKALSFRIQVARAARGVYRGDPHRVRQILQNLVSNALKFTDAGAVKVSAAQRKGALILTVRDSGAGVPPEMAEQVFRKFEQADASTTRRFGGTGLGLAICQDLAVLMSGTISVKNARRSGAIFTATLPLPRVRSPALRGPAKARVAVPSAGLRVLVAEDNDVNQLVLKTLLGQIGIEPTMVPNGKAAVEAWEGRPWDLILMDIQMPEMDGPSAAAAIRRREAAVGRSHTPIIALTANVMEHQIADYHRSGMNAFVAKPIEVAKLFEVMQMALAPIDEDEERVRKS